MHRTALALVGTVCLLAVAGSLPVQTAAAFQGGKIELQKRQERQQQFLNAHSDRSGRARPDLWQRGILQQKQMKIAAGVPVSRRTAAPGPQPLAPSPSGAGLTGVQWTQVGPAPLRVDGSAGNDPVIFQGTGPVSGEVVDIAIDPRNAADQVIYIATNDGGIWKTTDGGTSWTPTTDFMPSLSMGAVVLDPANPSIVYAGTGNPFDGGGTFSKGVGVYKSIDAGKTWSVTGAATFTNQSIVRMAMPAADTLVVGSSSGVYRSADGGATYKQIVAGSVSDLKLDPTSSSTVLAAVNGSLLRSTDSGATFPTTLRSLSGFTTIAQSEQPDDQTMYLSNFANGAWSLQRSTDGGANWATAKTGAPSTDNGGCQCGYDQTVGVDPLDATRVYVGFQELYVSTDSGASFTKVSQNKIHFDHHALVFSPASHRGTSPSAPTRLFVGTDGGISTSGDGGGTFSNIDEGIATNLFQGIDIGRGSATNNAYTYGGTQDTGTEEHQPGFPGADWHMAIDGDGGPVAVDPANPQVAYGSDDGGFIRTSNGGNSWNSGNPSGLPGASLIAIDPNSPSVVYVARGSTLYQSTDTAGSFTAMHTFPSGVTAIATTAIDSNTLWVGLANGSAQSTGNALAGALSTWTSRSPGSGAAVGGVAIDPTNTAQVVVAYAGFSNVAPGSRTRHVFRTADGGQTWTDISGTDGGPANENLPDLPLHSVVIDPNSSPHTIVVASDAGVLRTADGGASWQVLGVGLPTVDSKSLALDASVSPSVLRIGTYGRSVFQLTAATGPLIAVNADLAFGSSVSCGGTGPATDRVIQVFNVGSSDLHITSVTRQSGSSDFQLVGGPATPVTVPPGGEVDFTVRFQATSAGDKTATFQINSDDPFQPAFTVAASASVVAGSPTLAVSGSLDFGTVPRGTTASRTLSIFNTGNCPLDIASVAFAAGSDSSFSVLNPGTPQTVAPGSHIDFTIQFSPPVGSDGATRTGILVVTSNDAGSPLSLPARGIPGVPLFVVGTTAMDFGQVPVDNRTSPSSSSLLLQLFNQSSCALCDLRVTAITIAGANASDFALVGAPSLPAAVGAGTELDLTVRFNPSGPGVRAAILTVTTDDPANPIATIHLSGVGLLPAIGVGTDPIIFGPTVFDPVCGTVCGSTVMADVQDTGQAELILDNLSVSGASAFSAPAATAPPTRLAPGDHFSEPVTFRPTGSASRALRGTLHIEDSLPQDPGNVVARDVPLCGESVGRGIRVLVITSTGTIVSKVDMLKLSSNGVAHPVNVNEKNLTLTTIDPPTACQTIQFQYENQSLPATDQSAPRSSFYSLSVHVGTQHADQTFTLAPNEFKTIVVTLP